MSKPIQQGQFVAKIHAAESAIGSRYFITGVKDDGEYSANPGDYWNRDGKESVGAIIKHSHPYHTVTGRIVYGPRVIKSNATMADLRRLAKAAISRVVNNVG